MDRSDNEKITITTSDDGNAKVTAEYRKTKRPSPRDFKYFQSG